MVIDSKKPAGLASSAMRPFRRAVLGGLGVLCPPLLTVLIIVWAINTTKSYFLEPVTGWAREGLVYCLADIRDDLPAPLPGSSAVTADGLRYHRLDNGTFIPDSVYELVRKQSDELLPSTGEGFYRRYVDLTYLRPLSVRSGRILAEGKLIKLGRQTSYAEGFVRDGAGNLAVHATATFSMIGEAPKTK